MVSKNIHLREIETLHFFQWKILGLLFKVLDRDNESSCFNGHLRIQQKHC